MQSQFTDKAQNALAQAGRCARGLKQGYIGYGCPSYWQSSWHCL